MSEILEDRKILLHDRDADSALEAFADLPDWLAAVMAPDRVADAKSAVGEIMRTPQTYAVKASPGCLTSAAGPRGSSVRC